MEEESDHADILILANKDLPLLNSSGQAWESLLNQAPGDPKTDKDLTLIKKKGDYFVFRIKFSENKIVPPAYEYKVQGSVKYDTSNIPTGKVVLNISMSEKNTIPFVAQNTISTFNEDFRTPRGEESLANAIKKLREEQENADGTSKDGREEKEEIANRISTYRQLLSNSLLETLKHQQGYAFIPFGVSSSRDGQTGMTFGIEKKSSRYQSIRFRLKRLTDRKLVFEDLKKDEELSGFFDAKDRNIKYHLNTEITGIAYHDTLRPGGVARLPDGWKDIATGGTTITTQEPVMDGDCIIFKNTENNIIARKPYPVRVSVSGDDYTFAPLIVYTPADVAGVTTALSFTTANKYKIVNYFDLGTFGYKPGSESPALTNQGRHRGVSPLKERTLKKLYKIVDDKNTPASSVDYPIIVGSKRFCIEEGAVFKSNEDAQEAHSQSIDGGRVRVNLELSEVAKHWAISFDTYLHHLRVELARHWNKKYNHDAFSDYRNILFRSSHKASVGGNPELAEDVLKEMQESVQIELVNEVSSGEPGGRGFFINVKLATNREYRYIYKKSSDIKKIEVNGSNLTSNSAGIINLTEPNIVIQVIGGWPESDTHNKFETILKPIIYKNFLLMESAQHVDQIAITGNSNEIETAIDYFDYQIPKLNNGFMDSNLLDDQKPYDFSYSEGFNWLSAYGHKRDNLVMSNASDEDFASSYIPYEDIYADLMYEGGMPATVEYIYPEVLTSYDSPDLAPGDAILVRFFINKGYWNGFNDAFAKGSSLFKTRPKKITCDLQKLNGSNWEDVSWGKGIEFTKPEKDWQTASAVVNVLGSPYSDSGTYRLKVTKVLIGHGVGASSDFYNKALRFPFSVERSIILDKDLTEASIENRSRGIHEHRISMIENPIIKGSPAFPADGLTRLGKFEFKKIIDEVAYPCVRYYMFRVNYSIRASYSDKISRNGISKVNITKLGRNYKLPPTVAIDKPVNASKDNFRGAVAKATIEDGRLKFIEVTDSGSGYFDVETLLQRKDPTDNTKMHPEALAYLSSLIKDTKKSKTPFVFQSSFIQDSTFSESSCALTLGQPTVTHDGSNNIVTGARLEGTGVPNDTTVLSVASSTSFTMSNNATQGGTVAIIFDSTELELAFIADGSLGALQTTGVTLTSNTPDPEVQEEFGLVYEETEAIAEASSPVSEGPDVNSMDSSAEGGEWELVEDVGALMIKRNKLLGKVAQGSSESSNNGIFVDDEHTSITNTALKGRENEHVDGLYDEDELDSVPETTIEVVTDDQGQSTVQFEVQVTEKSANTQGSAIAIINDRTFANYRIIDNEFANKATPHLSSFSRNDNPSMPKTFGMTPGAALSSEVFNNYARMINNMHSIRLEAPMYARVKRHRQYEYRFIEDMAGLTFENDPKSTEVDEVVDSTFAELDYTEFDKKSKVNYFTFIHAETGERKRGYFSAFGDEEQATSNNIVKGGEDAEEIYDFSEDNITKFGEEQGFEALDEAYSPKDINLPSRINIGKSNGVFCSPRQSMGDYHASRLEDGMELPEPTNRRASAYSGKLIHTSEAYDITDEDSDLADRSFVDLRGSSHIRSSSQNEIIFGCFFDGKPFLSTFLKTTREWTEYEIIPSPQFANTLPVGIRNKYKPEETTLRCNFVTKRVTCSNEKFSTVDKSRGDHNLCNDGRPINGISDSSVSYEGLFGLNEGDDVIGPVETDFEKVEEVFIKGKGTLKVEPEFNLSLAVYASHKAREYRVANDYNTSVLTWYGPCIHKCSPLIERYYEVSNDPLLIDLRK